MKKLLPLAAACVLFGTSLYSASAQTPEAFKYQASLRNSQGEIISDRLISLRVTILSGSNAESGKEVYSELHTVLTNKLGLVNIEIGNGKSVAGAFSAINWENGKSFIRIEMDENGGGEYKTLCTSQLLSVPYALHSKMASDVLPGAPAIQNEAAERKNKDSDLQSQINILMSMQGYGTKGGSDKILGIPEDIAALRNRYVADSAAKNTRINNDLTRFTNDSVAVRGLITNATSTAAASVLAEKTRAIAEENALANQISITAATVLTEKNRALAAEDALSKQISNSGGGGGWSKTGNAGTTPGTDFIGTTDAKDFVVKTNNTERIRLTSGGAFMLPRMTTADRDALPAEAGMTIYNTTSKKFQGYELIEGVQTADVVNPTDSLALFSELSYIEFKNYDPYGGPDEWQNQDQYSFGQSFTANTTNPLTAITFYLNSFSRGGTYTFNVYAGEGMTGSKLFSTELTLNPNYYNLKEVTVPIAGLNLTAGNTYTFEVESSVNPNFDQDGSYLTGSTIKLEYTNANDSATPDYSGGEIYINKDALSLLVPGAVYDMRFKVHVTPQDRMGWVNLR